MYVATPNASASRLPMVVYIAWRNIWRNPVRSLLTISALAGGLVMVILYAGLLEGMSRQMVKYATEISTGHIQIHRQGYIDDQDLYAIMPWSYLPRIDKDVAGIHLAPRLYAAGLASTRTTSNGVLIKAVDPQREPEVTKMLSHIRSGSADLGEASPSEDGLPRNNVVVGAQLAKNMNIKPGSELVLVTQAADGSIGNALYRVAAVLKPLEPNFDRMGVLMSIQSYKDLMYLESGFHELAIRVDDITAIDNIQGELQQEMATLVREQPLDRYGGEPVARSWRQINPSVSDMLELSKSMLFVVGLIIIGLASLGMLNTMLMAVHERTHEFGILLSIGMKRRWLLTMVLFESLFLALVSAAAGSALGSLASLYMETHGIDFSVSMPDGYDWAGVVFEPVMNTYLRPVDVLDANLLMIAVTLVASFIPSWRTVRMKPAEVMR